MVEQEILIFAYEIKWSLDVYNSEAIFMNGRKRTNPGLQVGTPDLIGCAEDGTAIFIELKDPKKDKVCRLAQRNFLMKKIEASNCFAAVISSKNQLKEMWNEWKKLEGQEAKIFLKSKLPKKVLFNDRIVQISD